MVLFYANCIKAIFYFSSRRSFPFSCTHTHPADTHSWCPKRVGSCALALLLLLLLLLLLFFVEDYGFNAKTKLKTVQIPLKVNGSYDKKLAKLQIGLFSSTKQLPVLASKPALVLKLVWLAGWLWHPQKRGDRHIKAALHACQALDKVLKEHLFDVWKFSNLQI